MTTTPATPRPPAPECSAHAPGPALQRQAGYLVKNLDHGVPMTEAQALALAREHATTTGGRWGVYRLCAVELPPGDPLPVAVVGGGRQVDFEMNLGVT